MSQMMNQTMVSLLTNLCHLKNISMREKPNESIRKRFINELIGKTFENTCTCKLLTLIREFLGPSPSAFSGKKSRIIADDVTVGT